MPLVKRISELSDEQVEFCINKMRSRIIDATQKQTEFGQLISSIVHDKIDEWEILNNITLSHRSFNSPRDSYEGYCSCCRKKIDICKIHISGATYFPGTSKLLVVSIFCDINCLKNWMQKPPIKEQEETHQIVYIPTTSNKMRIEQAVDDAAQQILNMDAENPKIIDQIIRNCFGSLYDSVEDVYEQVFYRIKEISRDE